MWCVKQIYFDIVLALWADVAPIRVHVKVLPAMWANDG